MSDAEFVAAFEACTLDKSGFTHDGHLRLAWLTLLEAGEFDAALVLFRSRLQRYALSIGKPGVYHETLTVVWLRLVRHAIRSGRSPETFNGFLVRCDWLRDRTLPAQHYSAEILESLTARQSFVEPDLRVLPDR